jgi:hypothetical protein
MMEISGILKRWLACLACLFPMAGIPSSGGAQATGSSQCAKPCLTLHGSKDADHGVSFSVAYTTTAKTEDCVTHNGLAGVTTQQSRYEFLPPVRKGETYRIEIPLGKYTGGKCGWKVAAVFLDIVSVASRREPPKPGHSLFLFDDEGGTIQRLDLKCRRSAYKRASGAEQAAYLCQLEGVTPIPALGSDSHVVELNFGTRQ